MTREVLLPRSHHVPTGYPAKPKIPPSDGVLVGMISYAGITFAECTWICPPRDLNLAMRRNGKLPRLRLTCFAWSALADQVQVRCALGESQGVPRHHLMCLAPAEGTGDFDILFGRYDGVKL